MYKLETTRNKIVVEKFYITKFYTCTSTCVYCVCVLYVGSVYALNYVREILFRLIQNK